MTRIPFACVVLVAYLSVGLARGQSSSPGDALGQTLQVENVTIHYAASHEEDARQAARFLPSALDQLRQHFRPAGLEKLVIGFRCRLYLHPRPTTKASESVATCLSGTTDGTLQTYYADIHLLTPSAHSKTSRTHIGEPKDQVYFERLLVHEYAAPVLDCIRRSQPRGWSFYSAPRWFYEGYEEYLGLICSNEHSRTVTMAKYRAVVQSDARQVRNDFGLVVENEYLGGAMLVAFMYDHYGKDRTQSVLTSEQETFGQAVSTELGVTLDSFYAAWRQWLI